MAKRKDKKYFENEASKWRRSAKKQRDLKDSFISGVEKGIQLAKEANQ